uniref:Kielin/chordin-like protein n=1 Tax=Hadrurus spadix TaxID=141984 RepID=A0A1W7RAA8_9SCOR
MSFVSLICVLYLTGVSARTIRSTEKEAENELIDLSCKCDKRFWAHYKARGCHPVFEEGKLDCPARFDCPDLQTNSGKCVFNGLHYDIGSYISTTNACARCHCVGDEHTNSTHVECSYGECFEDHNVEGYYYVYSQDSCCSVGIKKEIDEAPKCIWNNKTYYLGQEIFPEEDRCLQCLCTQDWNGINSKSCRKVDCLIETNLHLLQKGCIPIYHEKACCPIEYHCPEKKQNDEETNNSSIVTKDPDQCYFDGKAYNKGEILEYNGVRNCVTCTCCTPPDFTCIHQACIVPSPPANSNCQNLTFKQGKCCPEYDCPVETSEAQRAAKISEEKETEIFGPPHAESPCADLHCEEGEYCQLKQICEESLCRIYPQCVLINADCPTPLCAIGCYVVDIDKNRCPTCACSNNSNLIRREANEVCVLPNCTGSNCHLISNKDGCPICSCDPPCPICPTNCQVQTDISEGKCPECICNEIVERSNVEISSCPVPLCNGVNCTMKVGEDNCTHCVCLECSPPECESGCKLEVNVTEGCPKCECPINENIEKTPCPVPVCEGINCTMKTGEDNCSYCVCLDCSPPKCEPGCRLGTNLSEGCPKCECPENENGNDVTTVGIVDSSTEIQKCPELKCRGYNCRILIGTDGCQFCTCESKCPPTKCIPGCFVEKNPLPDHCPGCICHIAPTSKDVASNES